MNLHPKNRRRIESGEKYIVPALASVLIKSERGGRTHKVETEREKERDAIEKWNREVKEANGTDAEVEREESGIGWLGEGSFGRCKVTALQA